MASTPDASFSDEHTHGSCWRVGKGKEDALLAIPTVLPSPQRSDTDHETTQQAYQAIWNSFCGLPAPAQDPTFLLGGQRAYDDLYATLATHEGLLEYFERNIRRDWNANTGELTLRLMAPTCLHEIVQERVKLALWHELDRVASENPTLRPFRKKIIPAGQAQVQKKRKRGAPVFEQSPDGQFRYTGTRQPPFVLEIAYSQDQQNLTRKVTEIFQEMQAKISTVLAFDIGYEPREGRRTGHLHSGAISLWTAQQRGDTVEVIHAVDAPFRANGQAKSGALVLDFEMFVPLSERKKLPPQACDAKLRLDFADLSNFVSDAEEAQLMDDASISPPSSPSLEPPLPPAKRIRFLEPNGDLTREIKLPAMKRQRVSSAQDPPSSRTRSRTRSLSQPRRSSRGRSTSRD